jgi:hypothetical protein
MGVISLNPVPNEVLIFPSSDRLRFSIKNPVSQNNRNFPFISYKRTSIQKLAKDVTLPPTEFPSLSVKNIFSSIPSDTVARSSEIKQLI